MRLRILAIGRLRKGPEKDLIEDYISRFNRSGRPLGLGPVELTELEDKKGGGKGAEAALLLKAIGLFYHCLHSLKTVVVAQCSIDIHQGIYSLRVFVEFHQLL